MRNNSVKLFEFRPALQEEMSFKAISYLASGGPFYSGVEPFKQF